MRDFACYFSSLVPQSQLNRDTIVQKERGFIHSSSLLFITEERWGSSWKKKDDFYDAGGSGGKEIEDLNVFFRHFPSAPSIAFFFFFFFTFQRRKLASLSGGNFFLSNLQMFSLLSPFFFFYQPRGHLRNLEWGPHKSVSAPLWLTFSPQVQKEAEGHDSFTHLRGWSDGPEGEKRENDCKERKGFWEKLVDGNDVTG